MKHLFNYVFLSKGIIYVNEVPPFSHNVETFPTGIWNSIKMTTRLIHLPLVMAMRQQAIGMSLLLLQMLLLKMDSF